MADEENEFTKADIKHLVDAINMPEGISGANTQDVTEKEKLIIVQDANLTGIKILQEAAKTMGLDVVLSVPKGKSIDAPTEGKCVYCQGVIVEKFTNKFISSSPPIDGPDSKKQWKIVSEGLHCENCGLRYAFVPKKK